MGFRILAFGGEVEDLFDDEPCQKEIMGVGQEKMGASKQGKEY